MLKMYIKEKLKFSKKKCFLGQKKVQILTKTQVEKNQLYQQKKAVNIEAPVALFMSSKLQK